jgi:hypothetical protein
MITKAGEIIPNLTINDLTPFSFKLLLSKFFKK